MVGIGHKSRPQSLALSRLGPRRIGLGALALISILLSPALVVYELLFGLALVAVGYVARLVRSESLTERKIEAIGTALLAGPVAYTVAWLLAEVFDW